MWRIVRSSTRPTTTCKSSSISLLHRRWLSTTHIDPSIRQFTSVLANKQPVFQLRPESVRILTEPSQFYGKLLEMINKAEDRIFISSLYIGADETELITALSRRLRERPHLQLRMVLDLNRSTRPGPDSTAKLLLPLLQEFHSRITISMFRSPSLRGIMAKLVPPRFNEGWGTWHAKIYGADDDVMISGANLNKSYFTDRQDRYLFFSGQKVLAQYCHDFLELVAPFSYQLLPATSLGSSDSASNPHSYTYEDFSLHWPNSDLHPHRFQAVAEKAFSEFQKLHHSRSTQSLENDPACVTETPLLMPVIQAGQFNIREEESTIDLLLRTLTTGSDNHRPLLDLTSGYFSLYAPYQDLILNNPNIDCQIVAASPKANGFYGSKGISGRIPEGYTLYEQRFMKAVAKAGRLWNGPSPSQGHGVLLTEWEKPGWTYHAKGIWLSLTPSRPILTLFGSTNLNSRSAHIDTELSFLMILPSQPQTIASSQSRPPSTPECVETPLHTLRRSLASELNGIKSNSGKWKGDGRNVRWTTKFIVWVVKGML